MIIAKHKQALDNLFNKNRYIVLQGGTRSGKTYSIVMYLIGLCMKHKGLRVSAVSVNAPHLKRGIITDCSQIIERLGIKAQVLSYGVKFSNGSIIMFEHYDVEAKARGGRRDILFINEANLIDFQTFVALDTRTRFRTIIDYNPVAPFWAHDRILNSDKCFFSKSTYKDNPYLSPTQVAAIEANKDNAQWWRVFGEGEVGEMSNQVLRNWQAGTYDTISTEVIGLDFGFTNSYTAAVLVSKDESKRRLYAKELLYKQGLTNSDIGEFLSDYKHLTIIADCAEPKSIEELKRLGFKVLPAKKDILLGIAAMNKYVKVLDGANMLNEAERYVWKIDSNGEPSNEVVPKFDHCIDALRYAVYTQVGRGIL